MKLPNGETGAGKSILIDALGLVTGGRIQDDYLRDSSQKALVEAVFDVSQRGDIRHLLEQEGLYEEEEDNLIISREIAPNGRSTARVNGRTVTINTLKQLAPYLVDLHVQGEQHHFLQGDAYLEMIDAFNPQILPLRDQLEEEYRELQKLTRELETLRIMNRISCSAWISWNFR